jgi:transcriptional regulator with XRE-family HTH domain
VGKKIRNVLELAKTVGKGEAFASEVEDHLAKRILVHKLAALRAARGLSQQDVASRMGCSQGQVSKMEASEDLDLNFGAAVKFAQAIGVRLELTLMTAEATPVDQVKHHAFRIKRLADYLAALAVTDRTIADGVARFFDETAFNLLHILQESAKQLPDTSGHPLPLTVVDACGIDEREGLPGALDRSAIRRQKALCGT